MTENKILRINEFWDAILKRAVPSWEMDWGGGAHKSAEGCGDVEKVRQLQRSKVMEALKDYTCTIRCSIEYFMGGQRSCFNAGACGNDTGGRVLNQLKFTQRFVGVTKWKTFSVIDPGCEEAGDGMTVQMVGAKEGLRWLILHKLKEADGVLAFICDWIELCQEQHSDHWPNGRRKRDHLTSAICLYIYSQAHETSTHGPQWDGSPVSLHWHKHSFSIVIIIATATANLSQAVLTLVSNIVEESIQQQDNLDNTINSVAARQPIKNAESVSLPWPIVGQ